MSIRDSVLCILIARYGLGLSFYFLCICYLFRSVVRFMVGYVCHYINLLYVTESFLSSIYLTNWHITSTLFDCCRYGASHTPLILYYSIKIGAARWCLPLPSSFVPPASASFVMASGGKLAPPYIVILHTCLLFFLSRIVFCPGYIFFRQSLIQSFKECSLFSFSFFFLPSSATF